MNERDRATGQLVAGQAVGMAPWLPPDAMCLACGGIERLDQVRTLRRAGYDGFVIGRGVLSSERSGDTLLRAIADEKPMQRVSESIHIPSATGTNLASQDMKPMADQQPLSNDFGI